MKKIYLSVLALLSIGFTFSQDLVFTGIVDGSMSGGLPKAIELYVVNNIPDMSIYGLDKVTNGGGTSGATDWDFPAVAATAGDYIWITSDSASFNVFFGVNAHYVVSGFNANGDDAYELYMNGSVVDVFGDVDTDGTGQPWDYQDGWAYRVDGFGPGTSFVESEWTFSGTNVLDNQSSNSTAPTPFPIGTYSPVIVPPSPQVSFKTDSFEFNESAGTVHLDSLLLNPEIATPAGQQFEVHLDANSTADTADFDFTVGVISNVTLPYTHIINISAFNFTAAPIDVTINDDNLVEGDEYVRFVLKNGANGMEVGADSVLYLKIIDNDFPADTFVELSSMSATVSEDAGSFDIDLDYQQTATNPLHTVDLMLVSGDMADVDNFATMTATFNSLTEKFTVNITEDALVETSEVLTFALTNPTNGLFIGSDSIFTLTITDNDFPYYPIELLRGNDMNAVADSSGVKCWTSGYVMGNSLSTSAMEFSIHNGTKGLGVYIPASAGNFGYTLTEGDSLMILATIGDFNGFSQLTFIDTLYQVGTSALQTPTVVTDTLGEYTESELITIENAIHTGGTWDANETVTIEANGLEYSVRLDAETGIDATSAPAGAFNITGLGSQYNFSTTNLYKGYQMKPRYEADIELLPTLNFDAQGSTEDEDAGTVTINFTVANDNGGSYTVDVELTSGDAADLDGFTNLTGVAVSGGMGSFDVTITDDAIVEGNEGFVFTLTNASTGLTIGNGSSYELTVADNDADAISEINVNALTVYPNPASEKVVLKMISNEKQIANVTLVDVVGKMIQSKAYILNNGTNAIELDLTNVSTGNYMINISTENGSHTENLIVK